MIKLKKISIKSYTSINKYFNLRENYSSESSFLYYLFWKKESNYKYIANEKSLYIFGKIKKSYFCFPPFCKKELLNEEFKKMYYVFKKKFHCQFKMICIDEITFNLLNFDLKLFDVITNINSYDYLYDYKCLLELKGKKMQKKRNLLNNFIKNNKNYTFTKINNANKNDIIKLEKKWMDYKSNKNKMISYEKKGLAYIIKNIDKIDDIIINAVYIDNKIEAFEISSYCEASKMLIIHCSKANLKIKGLYTYLMVQNLKSFNKEIKYVNREEDMGINCLKSAKEQLCPIRKVKKYTIIEKK